MDEIIKKYYRDYGNYCNHRCLPLDVDGLKPVERRILLSTYQIAKERFVKSAKINGHNLFHFHPHGDSYGTLIQMVHQGFVIGQGNWGCNLGIDEAKAAAMRYTEARIRPITIDLALKLINYVPWIAVDLDEEPLYFPAKYPMCLLGNCYTTGIGFGYRTIIPCYSVEDLHKRLLYLLKMRKRKPIIKPKTDCDILSNEKDLDLLLINGRVKIRVKGNMKVDVKNYKVILKSWPPGITWDYILKKLSKSFAQGDIDWDDLSSGEKGTEIVFSITKQRNKKKTLVQLVSKLENIITSNISFDTIVVDIEGKVRRASIDELLLKSYENYMKATDTMLKSEINRIIGLKTEYEILLKLRPFLAKHLNKIKTDFDKTILIISKESSIPESTIKLIFSKYKINKLLTLNIDLNILLGKIKELRFNLKNIKNYVLKEYEI